MNYDIYVFDPCPYCKGDDSISCLNHNDSVKVIPAEINSYYRSLPPIKKYELIQTLLNLDISNES